MLLSRLIPLLMLGGVGAHSGAAVQERVKSVFGVAETVVTRQRMIAVTSAVRLHVASGDVLNFRSDAAFRKFVQKNVRIKGDDRGDASLDMWGTPFKGKLSREGLTISSAGPDKKFGTQDDIVVTNNVFNY